jgi:hypothetical protein
MSDLFILVLLAIGQITACAVLMILWHLSRRLILTTRLRCDRGLSYTWRRAWRKAGFHLLY